MAVDKNTLKITYDSKKRYVTATYILRMDKLNIFRELYSSLQSVRVVTYWTYVHVNVYRSRDDMEGNKRGSGYFKVNFLLKILLFEVSRNGIKKTQKEVSKIEGARQGKYML